MRPFLCLLVCFLILKTKTILDSLTRKPGLAGEFSVLQWIQFSCNGFGLSVPVHCGVSMEHRALPKSCLSLQRLLFPVHGPQMRLPPKCQAGYHIWLQLALRVPSPACPILMPSCTGISRFSAISQPSFASRKGPP